MSLIYVDAHADLHHCCSHRIKMSLVARRPVLCYGPGPTQTGCKATKDGRGLKF